MTKIQACYSCCVGQYFTCPSRLDIFRLPAHAPVMSREQSATLDSIQTPWGQQTCHTRTASACPYFAGRGRSAARKEALDKRHWLYDAVFCSNKDSLPQPCACCWRIRLFLGSPGGRAAHSSVQLLVWRCAPLSLRLSGCSGELTLHEGQSEESEQKTLDWVQRRYISTIVLHIRAGKIDHLRHDDWKFLDSTTKTPADMPLVAS